MKAIVEDRVRWGLVPDAITQEMIDVIADRAAGDARKAIGILRNAARTAKAQGHSEVTMEIIEAAIPEAKSEIQQRNIDKLNADQEALYEIITDAEEITPGELYDQYSQQVSNPKSKRMMRNYLEKMEHYNLVTAKGATRGRTYSVHH